MPVVPNSHVGAVHLSYERSPATPNGAEVPLVLLPVAFAGDWIWANAWPRLVRAGYDVIRIRSPFALLPSDVAGSIEALGDCVRDLLDDLGIERAVICGNSIGALVALDVAARHPDRVLRLVVSGAPGLERGPRAGIGTPRRPTRAYARAVARLLFCDPSCLSAADIDRTLALGRDRRVLRNVVRALRAARRCDTAQLLNAVRAPTLLLWGADDRITPVKAWRAAAAALPHVRIETIPRAGHVPMLEAPEPYAGAVDAFLCSFPRSKSAPAPGILSGVQEPA